MAKEEDEDEEAVYWLGQETAASLRMARGRTSRRRLSGKHAAVRLMQTTDESWNIH